MDLAAVKTLVKNWERAFKAQNHREPTKDDIKQDPSGIASQYALYKKLSRPSSSASLLPPPPSSASTSTSSSHRRSSGSFTRTPQSSRNPSDPTTPTPPAPWASRPSSVQHVSSFTVQLQRMASQDSVNGHGSEAGIRSLKRKASKAVIEASPIPQKAIPDLNTEKTVTTPKKQKSAYTGPIHDPNPFAVSGNNPFTVSHTPERHSPFRPHPSSEAGPSSQPHLSPFLHVGSPRKLKDVLEANSLKKIREREDADLLSPSKKAVLNGITPRTKARKRLQGEEVDTPRKQMVPRRQRGQARSSARGEEEVGLFGSRAKGPVSAMQDAEEEDDEYGPSPARPPPGSKAFQRLLDHDEDDPPDDGLDQRGRTAVVKGLIHLGSPNGIPRSPSVSKLPPSPVVMLDTQRLTEMAVMDGPQSLNDYSGEGVAMAIVDESEDDTVPARLATPPPEPEVEQALASQASHTASQRPVKTLDWSDEEDDEWDPEGGKIRRRVVITATRRTARARRGSLSDDDLPGLSSDLESHDGPPNGNGALDEDTVGIPPEGQPASPLNSTLAPPLLSLLTLRSPTRPARAKEARLADLRVKALFNPADATRLKAMRKGQEVHEAGDGFEGEQEGEEWMERYGLGLTEEDGADGLAGAEPVDEDWESESDGWKRAAGRMDDDGDW